MLANLTFEVHVIVVRDEIYYSKMRPPLKIFLLGVSLATGNNKNKKLYCGQVAIYYYM